MPINPNEDKHASGLYRAMALRMYCRYVELRQKAKFCGEDLPDHGRLPSQREAFEQYERDLDEWVLEPPASLGAVVEFAGVLAADKLLGDLIRAPVGDLDAYHQMLVLGSAASWLGEVDLQQWLDRREAAAREARP